MEIRTLRITNYRGVTSLKLDLHKRLYVFYGVNGSGKSTMLDAVAVMLSWVVSRLRFARSSGRPIIEPEISNGKSFSTIEIECNKGDLPISWNLTKFKQKQKHKRRNKKHPQQNRTVGSRNKRDGNRRV